MAGLEAEADGEQPWLLSSLPFKRGQTEVRTSRGKLDVERQKSRASDSQQPKLGDFQFKIQLSADAVSIDNVVTGNTGLRVL
jgi:hypothetical protein